MELEVIKLDNLGRGISYFNNKIVFIPKTIPGDIIECEIVKEYKNYYEGKVIKIINKSNDRIEAKCPYYDKCGGCNLLSFNYEKMISYKLQKVNEIFKKNNIDYEIKNIEKSNNYNYRNKVSLKVIEGKIGYYESNSHELVNISNCLLLNDSLNNIIKDLKYLNIQNGEIIIRCNEVNDLLLIVNSVDKIDINYLINTYNIKGIILNNEVIYGCDYLFYEIGDYKFKVSYNSFFQVNNYICGKLFEYIKENSKDANNILDFYCGVGTLGIVTNKNGIGIEIVENAIKNANVNKIINNSNMNFLCSDTVSIIDKITNNYDLIILDPPRSGVNKKVINKIITENINKIIYVSCDPFTLVRDLKILLNNYEIKEVKLFDMFPNTQHVECVLVLQRKSFEK